MFAAKDKGKGQTQSQPQKPQHETPCRFIAAGKACNKGVECPFSHFIGPNGKHDPAAAAAAKPKRSKSARRSASRKAKKAAVAALQGQDAQQAQGGYVAAVGCNPGVSGNDAPRIVPLEDLPKEEAARLLPVTRHTAYIALSTRQLVTGAELPVIPEVRKVRIAGSTCWTLLKALLLCILIAVCSTVFDVSAILGEVVHVATPSAVVATQHGDDWIWDSGASLHLIGVQDTVNLSEADKIPCIPPTVIDTAGGQQVVDYKVLAFCKPIMQWVHTLVMPAGTPKVLSA